MFLQNCRRIAMFSEVLETCILDVDQSFHMLRTKLCPVHPLLLQLGPATFGQNLVLMSLGASKQLQSNQTSFPTSYNLC